MVRDISEGTFKTLAINRNTLTNVKSLDLDNSYLGDSVVQIALAHASGDGLEASCENTVDAVSELLGGQKIDGYAAVNMGAISIINHMAGGVTVTIEDDFPKWIHPLRLEIRFSSVMSRRYIMYMTVGMSLMKQMKTE